MRTSCIPHDTTILALTPTLLPMQIIKLSTLGYSLPKIHLRLPNYCFNLQEYKWQGIKSKLGV